MTLEELRSIFVSDDIFYLVLKPKSEYEMLEDTGQSIHTFQVGNSKYLVVRNEFSHQDYAKVE